MIDKEKIKAVINKICKSKLWEVVFVLIEPIIILSVIEGINSLFIFDKIKRIEFLFAGYDISTFVIGLLPYIFILLMSVFLRLINKNSFRSNLILTIICVIITVISYFKMGILEVPFKAVDLLLVKNVFQIAEFGNVVIDYKIIKAIFIIILLLTLQFIILKKQNRTDVINKKRIIVRMILAAIIFVVISNICITNKKESFFYVIDNEFEFASNYSAYGATFLFFKSIEDFFPGKLEDYTEENIEEIKSEVENTKKVEQKKNLVKPNIIAIMSESLSDVTKVEGVKFSEEPLKNIKEIQKKYGGNIVSPVYGGGTSIPEFEFLTGLSANFIKQNSYPYSQYITSNMNSVVRTYKNNNYECIGIHPNGGNFYNREVAYDLMGFSKSIFIDDMDVENKVGDYVSDYDFVNQIIKSYEENTEKQNKFIFGISIENHTPYIKKKYDNYNVNIEFTDNSISEDAKEELMVYTQGLYDADRAFKQLVDYFEKKTEPVILVIFGDHLPEIDCIKQMYFKEDNLKKHQTPYCVYANYDLGQTIEFEENISTGNLGLKLLELSNIDLPWYYKYIKETYNKYPVITNQFIINKENRVCTDIISQEINNYEMLQYDLLYKKRYIPVN